MNTSLGYICKRNSKKEKLSFLSNINQVPKEIINYTGRYGNEEGPNRYCPKHLLENFDNLAIIEK